jgi:hypothetical protein
VKYRTDEAETGYVAHAAGVEIVLRAFDALAIGRRIPGRGERALRTLIVHEHQLARPHHALISAMASRFASGVAT